MNLNNDEEKMNSWNGKDSSREQDETKKFSDPPDGNTEESEMDGYSWSERILEQFSRTDLFLLCCIAAGLLLIAYLAAFSCEVSWLLEAHGDLPTAAYLLCAAYFVMFVASTILIHGLVTGLPWGLFSWSVIIGIISIPELVFVMIMTTQHWGLQSTHGLTEFISYLIRLIINCLSLICIIPTALKWRRESQVLKQLQNLAARLQLQTPPPSGPMSRNNDSRRGSRRRRANSTCTGSSRRPSGAFDNYAFQLNEMVMTPPPPPVYGICPSRNEFNASIFGFNPNQSIMMNPVLSEQSPLYAGKKTHSLVDLRYFLPEIYGTCTKDELNNQKTSLIDENKNTTTSSSDFIKNNNSNNQKTDPIYCTISEPKNVKLSRNCISLENLGEITKIKNDLSYGNNLLQNYHFLPWYGIQQHPLFYHHQPQFQHSHQQNHYNYFIPTPSAFGYFQNSSSPPMLGCGGISYGGYTNPFVNGSSTTSKQSLGNESDDYRKYRDVAL